MNTRIENQPPIEAQTTTNADNSDLQPSVAGPVVIGLVDDVNGANAAEVPEFKVTRGELLELAKYWEEVFLSRAGFIFDTGQIGSTDLKRAPFAERRVLRIIELLGDDAVNALQDAIDEFSKGISAAAWKEFRKYLGPQHYHGRRQPL